MGKRKITVIDILRNIAHFLIGWSIGYWIANLHLDSLAAKIVIGFVVAGLLGKFGEMLQEDLNNGLSKFNWKDVALTAAAGITGAVTQRYFPDVTILVVLSYVFFWAAPVWIITRKILNKPI